MGSAESHAGSQDGFFVLERSRTARCSPEAIMARVLDAGHWPAWQPEIVFTEGPGRLSEGDVVDGRATMLGFGVSGRSIANRVTPTEFDEDVIVGVRMRIRYEVTPHPEGARVSVRMLTELPRGLSGRLLSFLLRRRLKRMQRIGLERLVSQAEAGSAS